MVKKQQRNIALLGMSDSNISTFTYFLRKHASDFFQISRLEVADAFIVDYDSAAGTTQWKAYCEASLRPAIVLCANDPCKINTIWVKKPVKASQLETAIANLYRLASNPSALQSVVNREKAHHDEPALDTPVSSVAKVDTEPGAAADAGTGAAKIQAGYQRTFSDESSPNLTLSKEEIIECCGTREDLDPQRPDFRVQVSYDDEKTLLAPVKKAIRLANEKHCAVEIRNLHTQIVILPGGKRIFIDLGNRIIRHMCSMPIQAMPELHVMALSAVDCERMFPTHHKFMHTAESVLWQLGLWTSRGRLPKGMNPHQALQLAGWPNLTRLEITPHAIHIAALWSRNSLSPLQLATDMHIPQRYVFAFAAAVFAINGFVVAEADDAVAVSFNKSWKKTQVLFSTILRSLKIAA